jgi:hypothetical protein
VPNVLIRVKYTTPPTKACSDSNLHEKVHSARWDFYSSNQKNDYVGYMDTGAKAGDYLSYAGNPEKSEGVFSRNGLLTDKEKKALRSELRKTKSPIWDMVISFEQAYGLEHIKSYKDALEILNKNLPQFLKANGMNPDNVIFFASLHENTDNRHIHCSWFEISPAHHRANKEGEFFHNGRIVLGTINDMKIHIEEQLDGSRYFFESYRRNLLDGTKKALDQLQFRNGEEHLLREQLLELNRIMPKGKAGYGSLEMADCREVIDSIETCLMELNPELKDEYFILKRDLKKKDDEMRVICKSQNLDPTRYLLMDKYLTDFHKRVGNKIIQYARKYQWQTNYEELNEKEERIERNIAKGKRSSLLRHTASLATSVAYEANSVFEKYRQAMKKAEYDRLVEEREIEP